MKKFSRLFAVVLAVAMLLVFTGCQKAPAAAASAKTVTVEVVAESQNIDLSFTYTTEGEMLADVLEEHAEELGMTIEDGDYGAYIVAAGGYTADGSANEFWAIKVNGEEGMNGASTQPLTDGDVYTIELATW